jgi:hypothetical protein
MRLPAAFFVAALLAPVAAAGQVAAPRVEARYVADSRDPATGRVLEELKQHIERSGQRVLAPGQKLQVDLLAVYLAGRRSGSGEHYGVRVYSDGMPARFELAFSLRDASNAPIAEGRRSLRSTGYFLANHGKDPLRYEKELLDDWLQREFAAR